MQIKYRDGTLIHREDGQERFLKKLYGSTLGRLCLKPLTARWVSRLGGWYMSGRLSAGMIRSFIKKNNITIRCFYGCVSLI